MNILKLHLYVFCFLVFSSTTLFAQTTNDKQTPVQRAHNVKGIQEDFQFTNNQLFQVKLFALSPPKIDTTHHWFVQVWDTDNMPVNYGKVKMNSYLKAKNDISLNYMAPVFPLCTEGKYIIGFVNTKYSGTWVLDISIDNFGMKDTITLEMMVSD